MAAIAVDGIVANDRLNGSFANAYELRRTLVRRLQKASRGVPRRQRVLQHQRFIQEWQELSRRGELWLVQRALEVGPAVASHAGPEWRESFILGLAAALPAALSAKETAGNLRVCAVDFKVTRADSRNPQADLFSHQEPLAQAV